MKRISRWPLVVLGAPAGVAIWGGWVGLGEMTGFGEMNLLPGIAEDGGRATINTAITLPIGMEAYAAYALHAWLGSGNVPPAARRFAKWSAIAALALGAAGQIAYHLLAAAGVTSAPWWVTTVVACFPVAVLGMGAALAHLLNGDQEEPAVAIRADIAPATDAAAVTVDVASRPAITADTARPSDSVAVANLPATATAKPRPAMATDTATKVANLAAKNPAIDAATVAKKLGCSERTARRHLATAKAAAATGNRGDWLAEEARLLREGQARVNGHVPDLTEVAP